MRQRSGCRQAGLERARARTRAASLGRRIIALLSMALVAMAAPCLAQGVDPPSAVSPGRLHFDLTGGSVQATFVESAGTGTARSAARAGFMVGAAAMLSSRHVGLVADVIFAAEGIDEFLGSSTYPVTYQFASLDVSGRGRVNLLSWPGARVTMFATAGVGLSWRVKGNVGDVDRFLWLDRWTNVFAVATGGLEFRRVAVEVRYTHDLNRFTPSSIMTPTGTRRAQTLMTAVAYRFK